MRSVSIFVNGILNFPGASRNWTGRAVTWTNLCRDSKAEKVEYFCSAVTRALWNRERAQKLARTLSFYRGWLITLTGHSNGADVICDTLRAFPSLPQIERINLVCPACEADFFKNGLDQAMTSGKVGRVSVYIAGQDWALKAAHTWLGQFLGYGVLGLHGPVNVLPAVSERVQVVSNKPWLDYGHSSCWDDANFERTMGALAEE